MIQPRRPAIKKLLLEQIRTLPVGTRLEPERKLSEVYGISRATMNKMLEELVREGYLSRRIGSGTFVMPRDGEFAPDRFAGCSRSEILVVYPDFFSYDIWSKIHHLEIAAMRENIRMVNLKLQPGSDYSSILENARLCRNLSGILQVSGREFPRPILKELDKLDIPVVILSKFNDLAGYRNLYSVHSNNYQSGYLKMVELLKNGHRRIGIISGEPATAASRDCTGGMKAAIREYRLRWRDLVFPESVNQFWNSPAEAGYRQALEILGSGNPVTGLLADTMPAAIGATRALAEHGLHCPRDISLVSAMCLDGIEQYLYPRITYLESDTQAIAEAAMKIVVDRKQLRACEIIIDVRYRAGESIRNLKEKVLS